MLLPPGGEVATSTVNRPELSRAALRTGVVLRQSWLFWPSMMRALIFSGLAASAANAEREPTTLAKRARDASRMRMRAEPPAGRGMVQRYCCEEGEARQGSRGRRRVAPRGRGHRS